MLCSYLALPYCTGEQRVEGRGEGWGEAGLRRRAAYLPQRRRRQEDPRKQAAAAAV